MFIIHLLAFIAAPAASFSPIPYFGRLVGVSLNAATTLHKVDFDPSPDTLGCTVEESLADAGCVFIAEIPAHPALSPARDAGLEVGDVIVSVSSTFGDSDSVGVRDAGVERVKSIIGGQLGGETRLIIEVERGSDVLSRHRDAIKSTLKEREIQGVDTDFAVDTIMSQDLLVEECIFDCDSDTMIDKLWVCCDDSIDDGEKADMLRAIKAEEERERILMDEVEEEIEEEVPPTPLTEEEKYALWKSGGTIPKAAKSDEKEEEKPKKKRNFFSISSPSGSWKRDPITGKMENIDP